MRRLLLIALLPVAAPVCDRQSDDTVVATVGRTAIHQTDVARRAAAAAVSPCRALEIMIEEELLIADVCRIRPPPAFCRTGDRREMLELAIHRASANVERSDVTTTSQESEFLRQRLRREPGLAANLAAQRLMRARLRAAARRTRSFAPVTVFMSCGGSSSDVGS